MNIDKKKILTGSMEEIYFILKSSTLFDLSSFEFTFDYKIHISFLQKWMSEFYPYSHALFMAEINLRRTLYRFGYTQRKDAWWVNPLVVFICLSAFVIYVTWAAFQGKNYSYGSYLSPLYSPELFGDSPHSWFGPK